jgi:hypothetical protein
MVIIDKGFPWGVLIGVIGSGIFYLIRDFFNNRNKLVLEKLKIYGKEKLEAYRRLFAFAQKLRDRCFPLADRKQNDFISIMSNYYKDKLELDVFYFDSNIIKILKEFNEMYICMTAPDLIPETEDAVKAFFEDKLFSLISVLEKLANKQGTV